MVGYRRSKSLNPDSEYFLTIVTRYRIPCFTHERDIKIVRDAMAHVLEQHNVKFLAWAILPNHLHIQLAPRDVDYSVIITSLKRRVSWKYRNIGLHRAGDKFWQDRFWEHTIRDEEDHRRCVEYIHFNPVRHELVVSPYEWPYSSFHRYVKLGIYRSDWGDGCDDDITGAEYD